MDIQVPELPYVVFAPERQSVPVIVASPHSGREYPADFVASARLDSHSLRRSEDSFVDELFAAAPSHGMPLLAATFPRAFCDPNREPWELDPAMFDAPLPPWVNTSSPRVDAGLGTIARVVASGEAIYRSKLSFAEAERRIRCFWQPYHHALARLIETTRENFGTCLVLDCHSMPAHGAGGRFGGQPADFVLGDAHGTACTPRAVRLVERALAGSGHVVRRNDPYSGGYITRHYGRPREGVSVLQIEVARRLYMDETRIQRSDDFDELRRQLTGMLERIALQIAPCLSP